MIDIPLPIYLFNYSGKNQQINEVPVVTSQSNYRTIKLKIGSSN